MRPSPASIGDRYGRLVIVDAAPSRGHHRRWVCRCDCGTVKAFDQGNLRAGASKSCGCIKREQNAEGSFSFTHGMTGSPEYRAWSGARTRCYNENADSYADYGGRGIVMCERWTSFEAFYEDMGSRPSAEHSLDRRDVNGNYEPSNCRWATRAEQAQGRRSTVLTWDLINEIRGRHEHGEPRISIAKRLGVRSARVSAVVRNRIWKEAA